MIETKSFSMKRREYFLILLNNYLRKNFYTYIIIIVALSIKTLCYKLFIIDAILILTIIGVFIYYILFSYRKAYSQNNLMFFKKRVLKISKEYIKEELKDGSSSKIPWDNISEIYKAFNGYIMYISKWQFLFIPYNAFKTRKEKAMFESLANKMTGKIKWIMHRQGHIIN